MADQFSAYISIAKENGLSSAEALAFARQMQNDEREARLKERELLKQQKELDAKLAAENSEREAKLLAEQRKLAAENFERERLSRELEEKLAFEKAEREAKLLTEQRELEAKLAAEQFEIQSKQKELEAKLDEAKFSREMELRKLELQKFQIESETRIRVAETQNKQESANASQSDVSIASQSSIWNGKRFDLGLGMFSNNPTELDAFLSRFEVVAKAYELPTKLWAIEFSKTLSGVSLEAFEMLSPSERLDYDLLVQALKKRFGITEGSYRKLFRTSRPQKAERLSDFVARLKHYLKLWLEKSTLPQTYDGLFELIVSQAFYQSLEKPVQTFVREMGKLPLEQMVRRAQDYMDAHNNFEGPIMTSKRNLEEIRVLNQKREVRRKIPHLLPMQKLKRLKLNHCLITSRNGK
jgi:actin-related protein